jgi:hypothetical protein
VRLNVISYMTVFMTFVQDAAPEGTSPVRPLEMLSAGGISSL